MTAHNIASPDQLHAALPATAYYPFIEKARRQISDIIQGHDSRLLLIVGPCSIHDPEAAYEYAHKIKQLSQEVEKSCFLVMRAYMEKPRTYLGWRGLLYDPDLDNSCNIAKGLYLSRQVLINLAAMEVPTAAEFVDPCLSNYLSDLIAWGCIGARTVESPSHRQMASILPMPIGCKNGTEGNIDVAIHAAMLAASKHSFVGIDNHGRCSVLHSDGNPCVHIILRGGSHKTNYDPVSINRALKRLRKVQLPQRLMIDCSHGNSRKIHTKQPDVFQSVINQILEGNSNIFGLMLESHLFQGNQALPVNADGAQLHYGISLTDPCIDWKTTELLVKWAHSKLIPHLSIVINSR